MVQALVGRNNTKYTKMTFDRNKNSTVFNVVCYAYKKKRCTSGRYFIHEADLESFVLRELKHIFKNQISRSELLESAKGGKVRVELDGIDMQEKSLNKEIEQLQNALRSLYQDKFKGKISERDYDFLYEDFTKNRNTLD